VLAADAAAHAPEILTSALADLAGKPIFAGAFCNDQDARTLTLVVLTWVDRLVIGCRDFLPDAVGQTY
jgi:hypothetical protein